MTKTTRIVTITATLLLATAGLVYAFRKKKPVAAAIKKVGSIVWPSDPDSAGLEEVDEDFDTVLKVGSKSQYVEQLKDALNDLHKGVAYINKNCGMKWGYFSAIPTQGNGNILTPGDTFDANTAKVSQFYFNRQEVELEYLGTVRKKIEKWKKGDKCIYPLSV